MRKLLILLYLLLVFTSCKSSKQSKRNKIIVTQETKKRSLNRTNDLKIDSREHFELSANSKTTHIIDYAKKFEGVRYKWGGATREGMDCSGLVFESFRAHDIILPRISRDMAKRGKKVSLKNVQKGDLVFFKTQNRRNDINHVGLITKVSKEAIEFIHSTTRSGVIISSLSENYWKSAFSQARRMM